MTGCADGRHPTVRILRGRWRCAACEEPADVQFPGQATMPTELPPGPSAVSPPELRIPVHCPGYPRCTRDVGHGHYADERTEPTR